MIEGLRRYIRGLGGEGQSVQYIPKLSDGLARLVLLARSYPWPPFLLFAAMLFFCLPPLIGLGRQDWVNENAQGPIILVSGLWLLFHKGREVAVAPMRRGVWAIAMLLALALIAYVISCMIGSMRLQWLAAYGSILLIATLLFGASFMKAMWFPFFYLLFLLPPPLILLEPLLAWLRSALTGASVEILYQMGIEVAHSGSIILIGPYEVFVADACAGMNSIFSLMAIGLFYAFLQQERSLRRSLWIAVISLPIAIFANFVRILLLLLVTLLFGDAIAQGPFHQVAGIVMFAIALTTLLCVDGLLRILWDRPRTEDGRGIASEARA